MRIWRDIPSRQELENSGLNERGFLGAVDQYHAIPKARLANIFPRIAKLLELIRVGKRSSGILQKMDSRIKSVLSRANAKIEYLRVLDSHYNVQNPDEIANPGALSVKLAMAQQFADGGKLIGIMPRDRMEMLDPIHRPWEHDQLSGGVNYDSTPYLRNWREAIENGTCNEPFLIYLEDTPHCLNSASAKPIETVNYYNMRSEVKGEYPIWWINHSAGTLRQWHPVTQTNCLFDTQWVTWDHTSKGANQKSLAYVFSAQKELVASLHNPTKDEGRHRFHHSSFASGEMVRCAGMMAASQGKITFISNDSGHYCPPSANLRKLVRHLNKRGVFDDNAKVCDSGHNHGAEFEPLRDFLAR